MANQFRLKQVNGQHVLMILKIQNATPKTIKSFHAIPYLKMMNWDTPICELSMIASMINKDGSTIITNEECLKLVMTGEELAGWLSEHCKCDTCPACKIHPCHGGSGCLIAWGKWLKERVNYL